MTKIEDMSEPERQAWITLLADSAVFIWFWSKTTQGLSPVLIQTNMDDFGKIVIGLVIVTAILHAIIGGIFEHRARGDAHEGDERDTEIERKGAHYGYRFMQLGIGGVVIIMLLQAGGWADYSPPVSMEKPAEIIFALMVISYVADLTKHGIMIWDYRA